MKRFIRTKDGMIIDTKWNSGYYVSVFIKFHKGIDKTADNIEDLLDVLVCIEPDWCNHKFDILDLKSQNITELSKGYEKHCKRMFGAVFTENGIIYKAEKVDGEWRVL